MKQGQKMTKAQKTKHKQVMVAYWKERKKRDNSLLTICYQKGAQVLDRMCSVLGISLESRRKDLKRLLKSKQ